MWGVLELSGNGAASHNDPEATRDKVPVGLSRAVVVVLNTVGRWASHAEMSAALAGARDETAAALAQLDASYGLVAAVDGAASARTAFVDGLTAQAAALDQMEALLSEHVSPDHAYWPEALEALESAGERVTMAAATLTRLHDEVPRVSDTPLINEVYALALNVLKGHSAAIMGLAHRLGPLRDLVEFLGRAHSAFAERNPGEWEISARLGPAIETLREAVGGFYVFLEEARPVDLSNALTLFDRAVGSVGACMRAMKMVESDRADFSEAVPLQRLHEAVGMLALGMPVDLAPLLADLEAFHAAMATDLQGLAATAWLGEARRAELLSGMAECLEELAAVRTEVGAFDGDLETLAAHVARLREVGEAFDDLQHTLEQERDTPVDLRKATHLHAVFQALSGVWYGYVPDRVLAEALEVLRHLHQSFEARLRLDVIEGEGGDETLEIDALMAEQGRAIALMTAYLEGGDRDLLPMAHDALVPSALRLQEIREAADTAATTEVTCVMCGASSPAGSTRCVQCRRALPVLANLSVSRAFDVLDSGAGRSPEAAMGENFRLVVRVIDQLEMGRIGADEALRLARPFLDTVAETRVRLQAVRRQIAASGDGRDDDRQRLLAALFERVEQAAETLTHQLTARRTVPSALRGELIEIGTQLAAFERGEM